MKFRIGPAIAGAMAVAATTLVATAGTANAFTWDHTYSTTGVRVYVEEHGDYVSVCDTKANGHSAYVRVSDHNSTYEIRATHGSGTCTTANASWGGNYNLREGDDISLFFDGGEGWWIAGYTNDH